jgi:hypothetical protein
MCSVECSHHDLPGTMAGDPVSRDPTHAPGHPFQANERKHSIFSSTTSLTPDYGK